MLLEKKKYKTSFIKIKTTIKLNPINMFLCLENLRRVLSIIFAKCFPRLILSGPESQKKDLKLNSNTLKETYARDFIRTIV